MQSSTHAFHMRCKLFTNHLRTLYVCLFVYVLAVHYYYNFVYTSYWLI
jgi:hypothetical protein